MVFLRGVTNLTMDTARFALFGAPHIITLLLICGLAVTTYHVGAAAHQAGRARQLAMAWALVLVFIEAFKFWLAVGVFDQPWTESLPLHLCRLSTLLCAAMLALRSYRIFEVAYFWVMGGSVAALLTPDLPYGFPHLLYFTFFIGHGLAVLSVLFAISAYGFRPRLHSITLTVAVTAVYMLIMIVVNGLLDTNFLYLREKPPGASIYSYLGPWPWYVLSAWLLGLVVCGICYLPFAARRSAR